MNSINIRRRIFENIVTYNAKWKCVPTQSDVQLMFGGLCEDTMLHLEQLEREGLLRLLKDEAGTIVLMPTYRATPPIEIQSSIAFDPSRGHFPTPHGPITLDLQSIGINVGIDMYGFQVLDDDMVDAGIACGDIAILTGQSDSNIVAVWIDGKLVLRRLVSIRDMPCYLAENPVRPDLRLAVDLPHYGTLWGVLRAGIAQRPHKSVSYSESERLKIDSSRELLSLDMVWRPELSELRSTKLPLTREKRRRRESNPLPTKKTKKSSEPKTNASGKKVVLPTPPQELGLNDEMNVKYRVVRDSSGLDQSKPDDLKL